MGGKGDRPGLENRWWVDQQKDAHGVLIDRPRVPLRFFRSGIGFEHVDDGPAAGRRLRLAEPLEVQVGEAALRPILLEADARAKEAQRHARAVDEDAVRVLLLVDPPAILEPGSVALATHGGGA